jgi:hypothetical protein
MFLVATAMESKAGATKTKANRNENQARRNKNQIRCNENQIEFLPRILRLQSVMPDFRQQVSLISFACRRPAWPGSDPGNKKSISPNSDIRK